MDDSHLVVVPQGRHAGAADRAQQALLRAAEDAAGARACARRSPTACSRARRSCRSRIPERKSVLIEVNDAAARRHPRRERRPRAHLSAVLFVRRAQLAASRKARSTPDLTAFNVNAHYALSRVGQPPVTPGAPPYHAAAGHGARHPQPVPRLVLQLRQAARRADAPRAPPTTASAISARGASTTPTTTR